MQTFDKVTLFEKVNKFLYIILFSTLCVVWLNQRSLSLYWQQEFHRDAPWSTLDQPLWLKGDKILGAFDAGKTAFSAALEEEPASVAVAPSPDVAIAAQLPAVEAAPRPVADPATPAVPRDKEHVHLTPKGKVFFAGDSMMQGIAPHIMLALNKRYGIQSINKSKQSTGLTAPGFFDWPRTVSETLHHEPDIELLVMFLGPNDPWPMKPDGGGAYLKFSSPEWALLYRSRIDNILHSAQQKHIPVIWIGPPNMRKARLSGDMARLNTLYAGAVNEAGQYYLSANDILGYQGDSYSDYQEVDGRKLKLRSGDGIHFTPRGQKMIADRVLSMLIVDGTEEETPDVQK
ncbi:DUF459 domain-containing protein [Superficieibacter sp.]|uniref:SGNH/GDSL hydrolase family protein n=1 Tax=Superficieibacter sp. TaxID=2303322 RepID=UPI0028ABEFC4|nr:DUF459 domain-containing protein [Superficieibacter sp.]